MMFLQSVILLLLTTTAFLVEAKKDVDKCESCTTLVDSLLKGLKRTSKGNYGGGNTDWEDRKLGNYLTSETRFEEIIEHICDEHECHRILEEHEDYLLGKYKTGQSAFESDLQKNFCVNVAKRCCPRDTFGAKCEQCARNPRNSLVCSGNGYCDGAGKRSGSGKCFCEPGYAGSMCDSCNSGYFERAKNDTHVECGECHRACVGCTGAGADKCLKCNENGWRLNEQTSACEDINECLVKENACSEREYCVNNEGSFTCFECDPACEKCTGFGAEKCLECNKRYRRENPEDSSSPCIDIDECVETPAICQHVKDAKCINKPGSYECKEQQPQEPVKQSSIKKQAKKSQQVKDNDNDDEEEDKEDFEFSVENEYPKEMANNMPPLPPKIEL